MTDLDIGPCRLSEPMGQVGSSQVTSFVGERVDDLDFIFNLKGAFKISAVGLERLSASYLLYKFMGSFLTW